MEPMDEQIYRSLLPLVNNKDVMDKFHSYVDARIEVLCNQLEKSPEQETTQALKGSI